jgi:hypothetical protein
MPADPRLLACTHPVLGVENWGWIIPKERSLEIMVDRRRERDVNEAAARFAETLAESYRIVYEQAADAQQRQGASPRTSPSG